MSYQQYVDALLAEFRSARPLRANSLIITVFGDAIAPHGGTVWLGSLIKLMAPFGLNQRLIRTSVYRLSKESWLTSEQVGRRSYYSLTQSGRRRYESACQRIYAMPRHKWDGQWTLVFTALPDLDANLQEIVRRELAWQGFGILAPGVLAHPDLHPNDVMASLQELELRDKVVVMTANSERDFAKRPLQDLVRTCWDLERLSQDYKRFLERFRPILQVLQEANELQDELQPDRCFWVRTLLIHEYRRVLRRDPHLPDELLPADWPGMAARLLCRNLYRLTQTQAERHLMTTLETIDGFLPEAAPSYYTRFGGLPMPEPLYEEQY